MFDSSQFESGVLDNLEKKMLKKQKRKEKKKKIKKELDDLRGSDNLLGSAIFELNQFEMGTERKSHSQIFEDFSDIIEGFRDEEDIVVPINMSGMKREIRKEKKAEANKLLRQLTGKNEMGVIAEEEEDEEERIRRKTEEDKNGVKLSKFDKKLKEEEELFNYKIKFDDIDLKSTLVQDIVDKIQIDSSVIKSLVGSRFVGMIKKKNFEIKKKNEQKPEPVIPLNILKIFDMYSKITEKKIYDLSHRAFSSSINADEKYSPLKKENDLLVEKGSDFHPFAFSRCEGLNHFLYNSILKQTKKRSRSKLSTFAVTNEMMVCGTTNGYLVEIPITREILPSGKKGPRFYNYQKVHQYNLPNSITSIDTCPQNTMWAAGTSNGSLYLRKAAGGWAKRTYENITGNGEAVSHIKFLNNRELMIAHGSGVKRVMLRDMKLSFDVYIVTFFKNLRNLIEIEVLNVNGMQMLITTTLDCIIFTLLLEQGCQFMAKIERPKYIERGWCPLFTHYQPEGEDYILMLIFWKENLYFVRNKGNTIEKLMQLTLKRRIAWATILRKKIICTIDSDFVLKIEVIEKFGINSSKEIATEEEEDQQTKIFASRFEPIQAKKKTQKKNKEIRLKGEMSLKFDDYSPMFNLGAIDLQVVKEMNIVTESIRRLRNLNGFLYINKNSELRQCNLLKIPQIINQRILKHDYVRALDIAQSALNHELYCSKSEFQLIDKQIIPVALKYIDYAIPNEKERKSDSSSISTTNSQVSLSQHKEKSFEEVFSVIIEALILAGKEDEIYHHIAEKIIQKGLSFPKFLEVLRVFINNNILRTMPMKILVKSIELEGFSDINKAFLLRITGQEIQEDLSSFQSLFNLVYDKQGNIDLLVMIRMSLIFPEKCLPYFLSILFNNLKDLGETKIVDTHIKILGLKKNDYTKETLEEDKEFIAFIRIFWFLWMIISWNERWWSKMSEEHQKGRVVMIALEWILHDKNFVTLSEASFQILLELFYQIFLDYFFMTSVETTGFFKALWKKLKKKLIDSKKTNANKLNSVLNPSVSYLKKLPLQENQEEDLKYLPEYMSRDENKPSKDILLCLQSLTPKKYQIDFSYLFVKILNLSAVYQDLLSETQWIKRMLSKLIGARFRAGRFWLVFTPLLKVDFEDEITRILRPLYEVLGTDYLRLIADRAEKNS